MAAEAADEPGKQQSETTSKPEAEPDSAQGPTLEKRTATPATVDGQYERPSRNRNIPLQNTPPGPVDPGKDVDAQSNENGAREESAVKTIQRNYRGYRTRRQMNGWGLDASTRWVDAIKEAKYQNLIKPRKRTTAIDRLEGSSDGSPPSSAHSNAQINWRRVRQVAKRAGSDDTSDTEGDEGMTEEQLQEHRRKRVAKKEEREENSKMMGLEYFLELVDRKHRYGSHLRSYHAVWKQADTHDNFFHWLDDGEGQEVELESCSRETLERDQVRYLSREERFHYLVRIGKDGRLRWAKNDAPISTNAYFKDSMEGIVPIDDDKTPAFREETRFPHRGTDKTDTEKSGQHQPDGNEASRESGPSDSSSSDLASGSDGEDSAKEGQHYVNRELDSAKGLKKLKHVSAGALFNKLLQSTTKKNTWIFVADTSFRLYIGIKQSGAFQHSSFLHGSRISAAGLIKVKDGQLRRLSPLSGHYRPPTSNFRAFVHSLRDEGVDMSRVSISRSYAVLLGLEGYMKTKKHTESGVKRAKHRVRKVFDPAEAKRREEASKDTSKSAQREREYLEEQKRNDLESKRTQTAPGTGSGKIGEKLERIFTRSNSNSASTATASHA